MIEREEAMRLAQFMTQAEHLVKELKRLLGEISDPTPTKRPLAQIETEGTEARCSEEA